MSQKPQASLTFQRQRDSATASSTRTKGRAGTAGNQEPEERALRLGAMEAPKEQVAPLYQVYSTR